MNVARVILLVIGLFGLLLIILGLLSLGQGGNIPFIGSAFGGWFLTIVGLFIGGAGLVGFSRMKN